MKNEEDKAQFIGSKIKEAREAGNKSQKDLAEALGFESATAISLLESGERRVRVEDLEKIATFLHKDLRFFIGTEGQTIDVKVALRADKELSKEDKQAISRFIDLAKSKNHGKS